MRLGLKTMAAVTACLLAVGVIGQSTAHAIRYGPTLMRTVVGPPNGTLVPLEDSHFWAETSYVPHAIAVKPDGGILIVDQGYNCVREIDTDGNIKIVAGKRSYLVSFTKNIGDGGLAINATLATPKGVAALSDGGFLIAEENGARVRKVDSNGIISTVAGTGDPGFSGDGWRRATSARLSGPVGVAETKDGGFLIVDRGNNAIRKVTANGKIATVAGSRRTAWFDTLYHERHTVISTGDSGDGGPATKAFLNAPAAVSVMSDGGFVIADTNNNLIRRVFPDGRIETVAGRRSTPPGPRYNVVASHRAAMLLEKMRAIDARWALRPNIQPPVLAPEHGLLATDVLIGEPTGVSATSDGGFLFTDHWSKAVHKVFPNGQIATVAGTGYGTFSGEGEYSVALGDVDTQFTSPLTTTLHTPQAVAATPEGGFLFSDFKRLMFVGPIEVRGSQTVPTLRQMALDRVSKSQLENEAEVTPQALNRILDLHMPGAVEQLLPPTPWEKFRHRLIPAVQAN